MSARLYAFATRARASYCSYERRASRGFTLIELMVVVGVVAILATIAIPTYNDAVRKGRRGQAKSDLVELAQRAERFRTVNGTYAGFWNSNLVPNSDKRSPRTGATFYYAISEAEDANTFTLTATPQGAQTKDTRCGTLTLNQVGQKTESGTATDLNDCW